MKTPGDLPRPLRLPLAAPRPVLAVGAYLKNTACWLQGDELRVSPVHGDLGDARACEALVASAQALVDAAGMRPAAVAHDLHPDFFSTVLAQRLAAEWGVPAVAVQHHRAHIAAVQAEHGIAHAVIGIALDGVGLGLDGRSWGGEILWLDGAHAPGRGAGARHGDTTIEEAGDVEPAGDAGDAQARAPFGWQRCAHLAPLRLPGGDRAAREPWRLAAALLHGLGRGAEIVPRFEAVAGRAAAALVRQQLDRGVSVPVSSGAGRWFDAAAAALGLHLGPQAEAEAAQTLQASAQRWVARHGWPDVDPAPQGLDLGPVLAGLLERSAHAAPERGAATFHAALAIALAEAATSAARTRGVNTIAFGGGCFHNALLEQRLRAHLEGAGLCCVRPRQLDCGDAGIALGQAWVASWLAAGQT